ncbi:T-cell-interacting, activating receptor on myeloid cells protein 1-like [Pipistrellus kuhlii]|uniref:T-cell-interacting, activating receptor on myeloid cells protein 1-like n=1 Tax=Pipistrellus kuhlii TaxID=59472 RepID=UPI001E272B98|nr:T-cell-interacting, activating receptor on myeloid cells protein 1-like [Pipistrellus kuhlii]
MTLPFLALLCVGLCAGHELRRDESLPRPSIQALPSWVLPANSHVTLRCSTPTREINSRDIKFILTKNNASKISSPDSPEGLAEFHLTNLKSSDAGEYTCEYRTESPTRRSLLSDVLLLLVTGELLKPSLHTHHRGEVTAGENVTLQCQQPRHVIDPSTFALLKKGTSTPIMVQGPVGVETDFSLPSVTRRDTGNYSCVYFQPRTPFWTSQPSDELRISVTGKVLTISEMAGWLCYLPVDFLPPEYIGGRFHPSRTLGLGKVMWGEEVRARISWRNGQELLLTERESE